ncbi:Uncharacterised protein [Neisseria meningitidis]|nr:Uncharacterised protein [Neisseria meningitidis]
MIKDPSFPRRRESGLFGFSCFWVSGNFQIVIPAQAGIQTFGRRQYSKIIRKFEVLDSRFHGNDGMLRESGLFGFGFFLRFRATSKPSFPRRRESRPLDSGNIQRFLDSDFKCNTSVLVVGTDSRIKHLAFRSQVFFLVGGSTHLEPCVSPDH